jgi:hypothetical protein
MAIGPDGQEAMHVGMAVRGTLYSIGVCPGLGDGTFRRISAQTRWNRLIADASRSSVASSLSVGDEMYELWDSGQ